MIVDSSVWIDYFGHLRTSAAQHVLQHLQKSQPVFLMDVIYQEVLQGAKSAQEFVTLQADLDRLPLAPVEDAHELHRQAATLYARCKWKGITIRSPNDCLIAACALESGLPVLSLDRDFQAMARIEPKLKLV